MFYWNKVEMRSETQEVARPMGVALANHGHETQRHSRHNQS